MKPEQQVIVFMGRSAAGKGTQSSLLLNYFKEQAKVPAIYIETGAHFREYIKRDNFSSKLSNLLMNQGERQPDFLAIWLWAELLVQKFNGESHLIFDGTPRSLSEALALDTALRFYGFVKPLIVLLNITNEVALERLRARGRFDDLSSESKAKRLRWFDDDVVPGIEFFRKNQNYYRLLELDGSEEVNKIHGSVIAALSQ